MTWQIWILNNYWIAPPYSGWGFGYWADVRAMLFRILGEKTFSTQFYLNQEVELV